MNRRVILKAAVFVSALLAGASLPSAALPLQDSSSAHPQALPQKPSEQDSQPASRSPEERKKTKKVWTNENLGEVGGSPISQVGGANQGSSAKNAVAKPASSQEIAAFRKQLATLQAQLENVEKQIADLKSFSKGEASRANGLQLHKNYTMEPVQDQVRKLEERKKLLATQIDAVFDAARKRGIEPGQLR